MPVVTEIVVTMYVQLFQLFQDIVSKIPKGDSASGHRDCYNYVCRTVSVIQDIVPNSPIGDSASGHRDCYNYVC